MAWQKLKLFMVQFPVERLWSPWTARSLAVPDPTRPELGRHFESERGGDDPTTSSA